MKKILSAVSLLAMVGVACGTESGQPAGAESATVEGYDEASAPCESDGHQFNGLYVSLGVGLKNQGHSYTGDKVTSRKSLPAGSNIIARVPAAIGAGGNAANPGAAAQIAADFGADVGGILSRDDAIAFVVADFTAPVAIAAADDAGVLTVGANAMSVRFVEKEISVDQKKDRFSGSFFLGYGKAYNGKFYVGVELFSDLSQDLKTSDDVSKVNLKTKGVVPGAALRLGFVHRGWLAYLKGGFTHQSTSVDRGADYNDLAFMVGGGLEKAFCKNFTLRLDADYIKGKDKHLTVKDIRKLPAGVVGAAAAAAGAPVPRIGGFLGAEDLPFDRPICVKKKNSWNVRLLASYHVKSF
ncbi:MAG: porin family protein [Holosporaceae bacterium]|jgi:opacity protein-like surface antigen|nr:porin family protein [Holosporaceae bacterium]